MAVKEKKSTKSSGEKTKSKKSSSKEKSSKEGKKSSKGDKVKTSKSRTAPEEEKSADAAPKSDAVAAPQTAPSLSASSFDAGVLFGKYEQARRGLMAKEKLMGVLESPNTAPVPHSEKASEGNAIQALKASPNVHNGTPEVNVPDPKFLATLENDLFHRYDESKSGTIPREQFHRFVEDFKVPILKLQSSLFGRDVSAFNEFEAGQLFQHYDHGGKGGLRKEDFSKLLTDLFTSSSKSATSTITPHPSPPKKTVAAANNTDKKVSWQTLVERAKALESKAEPRRDLLRGQQASTSANNYWVPDAREYQRRLAQQMAKVEDRMEKVRRQCEKIVRETETDAEGIIRRLRSAESKKLTLLRSHFEKYQSMFAELEEAIGEDNEKPADMRIPPRVQRMLADEVFDAIPATEDFERETADRLEKIQSYGEMDHVLQVKDQMIWELMQEREKLQMQAKAMAEEVKSLHDTAVTEISEWSRLTDAMSQELYVLKREKQQLQQQQQHQHRNPQQSEAFVSDAVRPKSSGSFAPVFSAPQQKLDTNIQSMGRGSTQENESIRPETMFAELDLSGY